MKPAIARVLRLAGVFVLFQGAWFAGVVGASQGRPVFACCAVAAAVGVFLHISHDRGADLRLIALAVIVGVAWDSFLAVAGLVRYASPVAGAGWAPPWILALWALFAAILREPMAWLHGRPVLAAAFGAAGGPLSYAGAARLGACAFPDPAAALAALAVGWAVVTPLLVAAAARLAARRLSAVA